MVTPVESGEPSEEVCEEDGRDYSEELPGEALASDKMLQEEVRKLQSKVSRLHNSKSHNQIICFMYL